MLSSKLNNGVPWAEENKHQEMGYLKKKKKKKKKQEEMGRWWGGGEAGWGGA